MIAGNGVIFVGDGIGGRSTNADGFGIGEDGVVFEGAVRFFLEDDGGEVVGDDDIVFEEDVAGIFDEDAGHFGVKDGVVVKGGDRAGECGCDVDVDAGLSIGDEVIADEGGSADVLGDADGLGVVSEAVVVDGDVAAAHDVDAAGGFGVGGGGGGLEGCCGGFARAQSPAED